MSVKYVFSLDMGWSECSPQHSWKESNDDGHSTVGACKSEITVQASTGLSTAQPSRELDVPRSRRRKKERCGERKKEKPA